MSEDNYQALTTKSGAIFVFPDGPNHPGEYIGCTDADDVSEPIGDMELIRCFDVNGKYRVMGEITAPPDPVTTTLTSLTTRTRNYLERIRGQYGLVFLQRDGGRADVFTNWVRAVLLMKARNTEKTYAGLVSREEAAPSTRAFAVSAYPPVCEVVRVEAQGVSNPLTEMALDVHFLPSEDTLLPIMYGVLVADAPAGDQASVLLTSDGGRTWTATAAKPFGNDEGISACQLIDMGNGARRILISKIAAGGTQGEVAWSDDDGANWHSTNLGGAAAGDGCVMGGALLAIDRYHIWLASANGYIYFSSDAGESWTAKEAGVIVATDYYGIAFDPAGTVGYAVGVGGVVSKTVNGGDDWSAATTTSANDNYAIAVKEEGQVWVGDDDGSMFYSDDGALTWTARTGFGTYTQVIRIVFINEYVGFALVNTGTPAGFVLRTIDGGVTWEVIPGDTNDGLGAIFVNDPNYGVVVGDVSGTYAHIALLVEP